VLGMTGVGDDSRGRRPGGPWLAMGVILAIGATLALVLSNDMRWLRLGILAALWAAVIGGLIAVKYHKSASTSEESQAQAQAMYELELEREIAARREYELEIESETRERMEADKREELDALRSEVLALRDSLQALFGGEVLYERVALTAQATRMRRLEQQRIVKGANGNSAQPPQIAAGSGTPKEVPERPTEMMDRVVEPAERRRPAATVDVQPEVKRAEPRRPEPKRGEPNRPEPHRPESRRAEPQRADRPESGPPTRRVAPGEAGGARAAKAMGQARNETTRVQRKQQAPAQQPQQPQSQSQQMPAPQAQSSAQQPLPNRKNPADRPPPPRRPEPEATRVTPPARHPEPQQPEPEAFSSFSKRGDPDWKPSWETSGGGSRLDRDSPVNDLSAAFPTRGGVSPLQPREPEPGRARNSGYRQAPAEGQQRQRPGEGSGYRQSPAGGYPQRQGNGSGNGNGSTTGTGYQQRSGESGGYRQAQRPDSPAPGSRPESGYRPSAGEAGGRRRRPGESSGYRPRAGESSGYRQSQPGPPARPAQPTPSAQPEQPTGHRGAHRAGQEPAAETANPSIPDSGGRRRRPEDDAPAAAQPSRPAQPQPPESPGGGRRRRPEGEPPSWQQGQQGADDQRNGARHSSGEYPSPSGGRRSTGSHARPDPAEVARGGEQNGRRSAGTHGTGYGEEPARGSHTSGRSVEELLAAYGNNQTDATPRRRRRAED
jgi:hypothetical protein